MRPFQPSNLVTAVTPCLQLPSAQQNPLLFQLACRRRRCILSKRPRREFHDYFVTHLPSSSLHPDSRATPGPSHKLPREESSPHADQSGGKVRSPAAFQPRQGPSSIGPHTRELTTVRIPLQSAKHHFGAARIRGTRPYNEDTFQAGTIEVPAFAKRAPVSLTSRRKPPELRAGNDKGDGGLQGDGTGAAAESASGDPQVFYFGVFDGHGGDQCSKFLSDEFHNYVEDAAKDFELGSSLQTGVPSRRLDLQPSNKNEQVEDCANSQSPGLENSSVASRGPYQLMQDVVNSWRETVGGYFRRFKPAFFPEAAGGLGKILCVSLIGQEKVSVDPSQSIPPQTAYKIAQKQPPSTIAEVLTYAFLHADLSFISQQTPPSPAPPTDSAPSPNDENLERHSQDSNAPFVGGSTASVALVSTPTPTPFWHPSTPLTLVTAHLGDTRILLCATATGTAIPLTPIHHHSSPSEAARLRRYAASFTTDAFGEERFAGGLANTRAFGDAHQKHVGVSAEPDLRLLHLNPGEASFMVIVSDGVSGVLSDREIVDVVKEARTPEMGAADVVRLAEELSVGEKGDADNATAVVVRMGGWERRSEGGLGSMATREAREWRRKEASDPRRGRT